MGNKGGRQRQAAALVRRTGKPSWFIRFYDEETKQTRHVSTSTADRHAAELFLRDWIKKREAPAEKPGPRVLPARLAPGVTKVRKNQDAGRTAEGHRVVRQPLVRQRVPDLEVAKKAFSDRMRDARIAAGLSQSEVAVALFGTDFDGTYRKRYINWEIGRSFMTQNVIPVFARLVGVDCNFLFGNEEPK